MSYRTMSELDVRQQLFAITSEEASELIQVCMKILRVGEFPPDANWSRQLTQEVGDLMCMLELLHEYDVISWTDVEIASAKKREKLKTWSDLVS